MNLSQQGNTSICARQCVPLRYCKWKVIVLHVIAIIPDHAEWPLFTSASRISQLLDLLFLFMELGAFCLF